LGLFFHKGLVLPHIGMAHSFIDMAEAVPAFSVFRRVGRRFVAGFAGSSWL